MYIYLMTLNILPKKNGSFRIVHDLQPLNAVTVKDAGMPPNVEPYAENAAGRAIYTLGDLFTGFDHASVAEESRDLFTFQTPLGPHRLTCLPMGWTNSVAIFQGHVTFILQDEIDTAPPYLDDVPILGPRTRYELEDGTYETLPDNPGIRRFIWEHLTDVNRIFHCMKHAGGTFSGHKLFLCVPEVNIVGHTCNYQGRVPDHTCVSKIENWPPCVDVSDVRGFLGTCGVVRIFIHRFAEISRPLVNLTKKGVPFAWGIQQQGAMDQLKQSVLSAPALSPIDYTAQRQVIVAVDSSQRAVGWIIFQLDEQARRKPAQYGSIAWNEREARYSQPKIELYGLYRCLRALRLHLIGLPRFTVEVDAQYIRGMLNNPDIQPSNAINRWIAGILLFDFDIVHVPGRQHSGPDGLSRRRKTEGDIEDQDDGWMDEVLEMGVWVNTWYNEGKSAELREVGGGEDGKPGLVSFISFSFSLLAENDLQNISFPRAEQNERVDGLLGRIKAFLDSRCKPADLRDGALLRFLRQALRFCVKDGHLWRRQSTGRHQQVVIQQATRVSIVSQAHDQLGHKGFFSTRRTIADRFWWPSMDQDIKWFLRTCHECQLLSIKYVHIPPTVPIPAPLFRRVHIDTMHMPKTAGLSYIIQARCSLISYPEFRVLTAETGAAVGKFLFNDILCRWGAVEELVTDNGAPIVAGLDWLAKTYHILHIRISPYNKQANGIVERSHRSIRESIVKTCAGDMKRWPEVTPHVF